MKEIPLTQGYAAIVDDDDYGRVAAYKWHANVRVRADGTMSVYAQRNVRKPGGGQTTQKLHRFILDALDGMDVDHINGNTLDNRRKNMRVCTHADNLCNQRVRTGCSSAYKGVYWNRRDAKWMAYIRIGGEKRYLGYFTSELDAARAYDAAAIKNHGEFAKTNGLAVV